MSANSTASSSDYLSSQPHSSVSSNSSTEQNPLQKPIIIKSKFLQGIPFKEPHIISKQSQNPIDNLRKDRFGNLIAKGMKGYHVTVGQPEVHEVESYKQFNENKRWVIDEEDENQPCYRQCNIF